MPLALSIAVQVLVVSVAAVVFLGFINLVRQGSSNRSQQLMRLRVGLQALAVVLMMTGLYLFRG